MSEQCRHEHMCGGDKTGMSAHTPGPWYVDGLRKTRVATAEDLTIATAHAGADRSKNKAEANARLIAAAPALLEALEAAEERIVELEQWAQLGPSRTLIEASAAIQLARGGDNG